MFVAKRNDINHIYTGKEIQTLISESYHPTLEYNFSCPICNREVEYNGLSTNYLFEFFVHKDGTSDCFAAESISGEHQIATEITVKVLHNRIKEVTGEQVEISVEKWIGTQSDFVIADVRVTSPVQIAAEIYYKAAKLALYRRLKRMFSNGYRTYLIFHTAGRHDVDRVEQYIQRVAPLRVGRFNPGTLELTLGDLFTEEQVKLNQYNRERLPRYIQ
ncbi:hypothetical protein [Natrarchaeobius oligotrophus]|uniref:Uncharacterized protein n=1 Tax=Natrarchaeobius chitinivorans TaxID=1679083 RepID=A0A3N6MV49_NATCH|nr:hypothetical protein [Natrarchaeobius chitinivorans]RQH01821.1 hypothetical protein EA472_05755 [Natrarchaeobius chitinivorans]